MRSVEVISPIAPRTMCPGSYRWPEEEHHADVAWSRVRWSQRLIHYEPRLPGLVRSWRKSRSGRPLVKVGGVAPVRTRGRLAVLPRFRERTGRIGTLVWMPTWCLGYSAAFRFWPFTRSSATLPVGWTTRRLASSGSRSLSSRSYRVQPSRSQTLSLTRPGTPAGHSVDC